MAGAKPKARLKQSKNKAKRWRKGHSSDSNPEIRKHRLSAKNRFFNQNTGPSNLTVDALAKHDAEQSDKDGDAVLSEAVSDTQSMRSAKTFATWATNWTDCTNTTFSKVHRYWNSNSAQHKEVLAILAAVTEVIKTRGGKETETEYFGALMTTLQTVEGDQSIAAVAYLLSIAIKRVPLPVLKKQFSEAAKTLLDVLAANMNTDTPALLRSILLCLASLLRVQEQAVWSNSSTMQIYSGLLTFITHPKPKVRKAAQQAVRAILKGSDFMTGSDPPPHHPAASATAKYCIQQIEECGGLGEATGTLHTMELLRNIMGVFPQHSLKSTCEIILRVMTLSNVLVTSVAMRTLHGMFVMQPKANCLPSSLNAQIITALYDYQPKENDVQPMNAWLAVMERAHVNLARLDEKLCISHLPRLFSACMACMQSTDAEVTKSAANTLMALLKECVAPAAERLAVTYQMAPSGDTPVHKLFRSVEGGLSYQYHASWASVLHILAVFFEVLGKQCHPLMKKCLLSIADLRNSYRFPHKAEVDFAVGAAVRAMGPKVILEAVPLMITGENDDLDFPRSWLLPVFRENIQDTELAFFTSHFLPLAAKLRAKSLAATKENNIVETRAYDTLQRQIWSLLPRFCRNPTDLKQAFPGIAKILGSAITERPDLRQEVLGSLRRLINDNVDNEENRAILARFAKNFLPIFFNLFTEDPEKEKDHSRLVILEAIKTYLQITDSQLVGAFFDKCLSKLDDKEITPFRRHALMDLCFTYVPYLDKPKLIRLYKHVTPHMKDKDRTTQKKCYRILEEICSCSSQVAKDFLSDNLKGLEEILLTTLSKASPSSKAPRLRCLCHIFKQLEHDQTAFLSAVAPEAILCTKAVNERARAAAYSLLVEMANALIRWNPDKQKEVILQEYLQLLLAGLAGSTQMVTTTVLALTRVLYEFRADVSSAVLGVVFESLCLLLRSKSREVVLAALGLLKVLITIFPDVTLAQFLSEIVSSLVSMKEDNKHHFRFKSKDAFGRLIKKFGFQTISGMVPESHHKLLNNIRKTQERTKQKKKEREEMQGDSDEEEGFSLKAKPESIEDLLKDSDSEMEDDDDKKGKKGQGKERKREKGAAWLQEGGADDLVDLLDPSVSKKVVATKPTSGGAEQKKSKDDDFKRAPDGRLIITMPEDEEKMAHNKGGDKDMDDIDDLLEALEGSGKKKSKKRKLQTDGDEDDDDGEAPMKYQAGGSGIHRPIAVAKRKGKVQKDHGAEYRSKKAGGDMKKKGKPDPFAYVPLEMSALNRRKQAKNKGQFSNLVQGAKKGAMKGRKQRHKKK